nr:hypothetical protein [Desulfobulbaceae bacterium]
MKKIEKVFSQLSELYEFNKKLQLYSFAGDQREKASPTSPLESKSVSKPCSG